MTIKFIYANISIFMGTWMKNVKWVGSSKQDLEAFPAATRREIGYALFLAQQGELHPNAKLFTGFGSGVYEIVSNHNKNAYRAVYVVNIGNCLYVLHAFQKKSHSGIKTPQKEINIIEHRLKRVRGIK